jgi:hypothetical protein
MRDSNQREIDLILHQDNTLYPIEIKATTAPDIRIARSFDLLERLNGVHVGSGAVVCMASRVTPLADNCFAVPVWQI